jgi:uncharacterized protein YrrD
MKNSITSDDILGKEAVDPTGAILGIVVKLHVSTQTKQIVGITIDQGFMKPDLYIGINHIRFFGVDTVMLSKVPEIKYKGMHVLTLDGNEVGIVKDVLMEGKKLRGFVVHTTHGKGDITLGISDIIELGARIIVRNTITGNSPPTP